ncbi:hypothetical protein ACFZAR_42530 [Streptomyces sp. NPDC008222]|uniref:hypothetical protein n=1 Tax=Streptomyces sp. NPDC008222 TaxID=3364820 RepID=UPI0036EF4566
MDPAVLAWLLAQLGPTTDQNDLQTRYTRLGSARVVALEVLSERRAKLLAEPLQLTVNGVATLDQSNNLTGIERKIASVEAATAPDDATGGDTLVIAPLQAAPADATTGGGSGPRVPAADARRRWHRRRARRRGA